ncbi:alpha/beta hydrolase [Phaeovulum vinaykumarii]|uniref:Serine aminopeptidase, S33 n=1 Tax=Phaeovulum vinaykumarii TaxID=407234 RepID=A0A1N7L9D7_9RHOB|nr:alpha/beta fold hydrolase [Phaeovulum vinaykumarii]SIS70446.1 Serine aminopeptidase, S33 [Phaeovulum vinaykumarii]SOB98902.1 serine aminopeptidase S33 family [Phaeovulum vinaykumarii]
MSDILLALGLAAGVIVVGRWLVHLALLRGLAAPRVAHDLGPSDLGLPAERVRELTLEGPGGKRLFAWLILPEGHDAGPPVPAVLVMHGWGANASMMLEVAPPLAAAGHAVLLIDARCHGRSESDRFTSMPRFAEDVAVGLSTLRALPGIDPARIALLGHSVGAGAVLLHAARAGDVCAVISLSAFAHPREVMQRWMAEFHIPFRGIGAYVLRHVQRVIGVSFDEIAPVNTVAQVRCPVLLVHGREDETAPFADALRLKAAAPDAQLLAIAGDHDLRQTLAPHADALVAFLARACRGCAPAA